MHDAGRAKGVAATLATPMVTRVATDTKSPPDDAQSVSELTSRVKEQL